MSAPEVVHRVGEQAKRLASQWRTYGWTAFPYCGPVLPIPGLADKLRAGMTSELEAAIRESATSLLEGKFSAHGVDWPKREPCHLFPEDLWRHDPVTGGVWPGSERFCFGIGYRTERHLGDIKFVWDLNRLQFLQPLAAAVALWNDRRALAAIEDAINSWADANPPFNGLSWNSGIELALRTVTLAFVASLCGEWLKEGVRRRIDQILSAHLYWLHRFPSLYSSANNHLIAEAMGEFVICCVLPTAPLAGAIGARARAVLEREAALQIFEDGTPAEQSPTYGAFTTEMLLVADLLARAFDRPLAPIVAQRITAFADFIGALACGRGHVPTIGDDDEGRVLTMCSNRENAYAGSVARAVAGHLQKPPSIERSDDSPELREAFFPVRSEVQSDSADLRSFRIGGYTIVKRVLAGRRMHLTVDHGPLGYLSIAAHGHADANAIILSLDDCPIFVDPGTYLYHSGGAWRDWFRGTGAHNTVKLDGLDQSVISGAFNWSHKAQAALDKIVEGPHWSIATHHDGYMKRLGVEHHRRVSADEAGIVINDWLVGKPVREIAAEFVLQLAPDLDVIRDADILTVCRTGHPLLRLSFSVKGRIEVKSGGDAPGEGGWVSAIFGEKVPAPRLVWSGVLPPAGLQTTLDWSSCTP